MGTHCVKKSGEKGGKDDEEKARRKKKERKGKGKVVSKSNVPRSLLALLASACRHQKDQT